MWIFPSHQTASVQNYISFVYFVCLNCSLECISNILSLSDLLAHRNIKQKPLSRTHVTLSLPGTLFWKSHLPWPSLLFFLETGKQSTHPQRWCPGPYPSEWIYPLQRTRGSRETPLCNHTGKSAQQHNCLITLQISQVPSVILNTPTEFHKSFTQLLTNSEDAWSNSVQKKLHEIRLNKGKKVPSLSVFHTVVESNQMLHNNEREKCQHTEKC